MLSLFFAQSVLPLNTRYQFALMLFSLFVCMTNYFRWSGTSIRACRLTYLLVIVLWSSVPFLSQNDFFGLLILTSLIFSGLSRNLKNSHVYLSLNVVAGFLGFMAANLGELEERFRFEGMVGDPNKLAVSLVLLWATILFADKSQPTKNKIFLTFLILLIVYLTASNSALLLCFLALGLQTKRLRRIQMSVIVILPFVYVAASVWNSFNVIEFLQQVREFFSGVLGRDVFTPAFPRPLMISAFFSDWTELPLKAKMLGAPPTAYTWFEGFGYRTPHNSFLTILQLSGFVGLVMFLIVFAKTFSRMPKALGVLFFFALSMDDFILSPLFLCLFLGVRHWVENNEYFSG